METILKNAKRGDKFKTRSGETVTFWKSFVANHKVFVKSNGEWFVVTAFGSALHLRNDIVGKAD